MKFDLPTVFRGCWWDENWEFDAPCVIYQGCKAYSSDANNYAYIEHMIENALIDMCLGDPPATEWDEHDLKVFAWRGWSPEGFSKRKGAMHMEIVVEWFLNKEGELDYRQLSCREKRGPFEPLSKRTLTAGPAVNHKGE